MESKIYNQKGEEVGKVALPEHIFGLPWNADLVHQVVVSMQSNARPSVAHTKDRSEVRGGGKKPWKQKGTGRARHGSIRSPLWRGGGVTFGPRNEKSYKKKINKKMKAKALYTVLSRKVKDNELLFIDTLSLKEPKTQEARNILDTLSKISHFETLRTKRKNSALIALPGKEAATAKSFRNFGNVLVDEIRNLNPVVVLTYKYIVLAGPKEAIAFLESKLPKKPEKAAAQTRTKKKEVVKKTDIVKKKTTKVQKSKKPRATAKKVTKKLPAKKLKS